MAPLGTRLALLGLGVALPAGDFGEQGGDLVGVEFELFHDPAAVAHGGGAGDGDQAVVDPALDQAAGGAEHGGEGVGADQLAFPLAEAALLGLLQGAGAFAGLAGGGAAGLLGGDQALAEGFGFGRVEAGGLRDQGGEVLDGGDAGRAAAQLLAALGGLGEGGLDVAAGKRGEAGGDGGTEGGGELVLGRRLDRERVSAAASASSGVAGRSWRARARASRRAARAGRGSVTWRRL